MKWPPTKFLYFEGSRGQCKRDGEYGKWEAPPHRLGHLPEELLRDDTGAELASKTAATVARASRERMPPFVLYMAKQHVLCIAGKERGGVMKRARATAHVKWTSAIVVPRTNLRP